MLPHSRGEAESIAEALHACSLGLHKVSTDALDDNVRRWVAKITELMDTKAGEWTNDQKIELSQAVDELAHWFERDVWEGR